MKELDDKILSYKPLLILIPIHNSEKFKLLLEDFAKLYKIEIKLYERTINMGYKNFYNYKIS